MGELVELTERVMVDDAQITIQQLEAVFENMNRVDVYHQWWTK